MDETLLVALFDGKNHLGPDSFKILDPTVRVVHTSAA